MRLIKTAACATAICLTLAACQNGEPPAALASLGITECNLNGLGLGALGGALAGAFIGRSWTAAAVGAAAGGAIGVAATDVFANQLGCDDQKVLARDTQTAAAAPKFHRVHFKAATPNSNGQIVTGYVMPTSNWYTDPNGHRVRNVEQVLTDGTSTQKSTIQVADSDLPSNTQTGGGYILPH
jgi:hypothetical protein